MKKVITFSLWGNNETYLYGAIKNAETALEVYEEFECWFYVHKETVPQDIIDALIAMKNVKVIMKSGNLNENKPRMWRFEAIDDPDVEFMLSRDTDTRILEREILAVREWLESDKLFHIMRDHPHHTFHVLAGMFGTRKIPEIPRWKELMNSFVPKDSRMYDQNFLRDYIYPHIKDNSIIHAAFHKIESHAKNFPIDYDEDLRFVGEYVYKDERRSKYHIDILRNSLNCF